MRYPLYVSGLIPLTSSVSWTYGFPLEMPHYAVQSSFRASWRQQGVIDPSFSMKIWRKVSKGWEMSHDEQIWACVKYLKCNFSRLQIWRISDCLLRATEKRGGWERADRGATLSLYLRTITPALLPSFRRNPSRSFFDFLLSVSIVERRSADKKQRSKLAGIRGLKIFFWKIIPTVSKNFKCWISLSSAQLSFVRNGMAHPGWVN